MPGVGSRFRLDQQERALKLFRTLTAAGAIAAATIAPALAVDISGAGATFPYPIYAKWADSYKKETGAGLNYQSIGSGGGIKQIQAKTVTFGATDMPLKPEELSKAGLVQFPTVIGGDVPVVNLEGVKSADLTLDGPTLAKIFMGEIKTWNDPAIVKLNPSAKLSAQPIVVVHRSDGSGTTFIWTDYLSKVSPAWKEKVGANTSVEWPVGIRCQGQRQKAMDAVGYAKLRAEQKAKQKAFQRGETRELMGIGVAFFTEIVGAGPSRNCDILGIAMFDSAEIRIHPTGSVIARLGTKSQGQGHETTYAQIIATELGLAADNITVEEGNTDTAPYGLGTYGSRSTPVSGAATAVAARKIKAKAQMIAAASARSARRRP